MALVTFTDKVDSRIINVPAVNKIVASDIKQLKDGVNTNEIHIATNATAIALNTPKVSFDSASSTRLADTSGTNTGDQDLSGYLPNTTSTFTGDLTITNDLNVGNDILIGNQKWIRAKRFSSLFDVRLIGLDNNNLVRIDPDNFGTLISGDLTVGGELSVTDAATFASSVTATDGLFSGNLSLENGKFLKIARNSGGVVTDVLGIPSGTDNVRILTTGEFNVVNGSLTEILNLTNAGAATFASSVTAGGNSVQNGVNPGLKVTSTNTAQTVLSLNNSTSRNYELAVGGSASGVGAGSFYIYDGTAASVRFKIDSTGAATFASSVTATNLNLTKSYAALEEAIITNTTGSNTYLPAKFNFNGNLVGYIASNSNSTSYITSSDYRLKEDSRDFNGLEMILNIPVYDYKWKADESRAFGVMAHELQEVLPQAVSGEKDAEQTQGVDYSKIVPLLIKSIQELSAEIELLKNK